MNAIINIRGRREDAEKTLCSLRGLSKSQVHEELKALEVVGQEEKNQSRSLSAIVRKLMDRSVLLPMALLVFLFFTQSFSGSNMVSYYTVTILQVRKLIKLILWLILQCLDGQHSFGWEPGSHPGCCSVCSWLLSVLFVCNKVHPRLTNQWSKNYHVQNSKESFTIWVLNLNDDS